MKTISLFISILILLFLSFEISYAQKENKIKTFACKIITQKGNVYQSLLLGTDWEDITNKPIYSELNSEGNAKYQINTDKDGVNLLNASFIGDELQIDLNLSKPSILNFYLVNMNGIKIANWKDNTQIGKTRIAKEFQDLSSGLYLLMVLSNEIAVQTLKLIKY